MNTAPDVHVHSQYPKTFSRWETLQVSVCWLWSFLHHLEHPQGSHPYTHRRTAVHLPRRWLWPGVCVCHQLQEPRPDTHRSVGAGRNDWNVLIYCLMFVLQDNSHSWHSWTSTPRIARIDIPVLRSHFKVPNYFVIQLNFVMSKLSGPRKILRHRNGST